MDFAAMFESWKNVLTRPGEDAFLEEVNKPQATLGTALIWIVLAAVVMAVLSMVSSLVSWMLGGGSSALSTLATGLDLPPEMANQLAQQAQGSLVAGLVSGFCTGLISVPLGFLVGSGFYWIVAKLLGGSGSFEKQSYLLATFTAPLTIVSALVNVVPLLGACVSLLIAIYQLVLTYFAIKVAHGFETGKALATVLIPLVIGILLAVCFVASVIAVVGAAFSGSGNF